MLCEAKCDAGGPNQLSETIGNLGLFTILEGPTNDMSELIRLNYTSEDFPGIRGVVRPY